MDGVYLRVFLHNYASIIQNFLSSYIVLQFSAIVIKAFINSCESNISLDSHILLSVEVSNGGSLGH